MSVELGWGWVYLSEAPSLYGFFDEIGNRGILDQKKKKKVTKAQSR